MYLLDKNGENCRAVQKLITEFETFSKSEVFSSERFFNKTTEPRLKFLLRGVNITQDSFGISGCIETEVCLTGKITNTRIRFVINKAEKIKTKAKEIF